MNELSPNGFYSSSAISDHRHQRIYRQYWEETWDQGRENFGTKAMNGGRVREYQKPFLVNPVVVNESANISCCNSSKKKRTGSYDPRFKRILNTEVRDDAKTKLDEDKSTLFQNISPKMKEDKMLTGKIISYLKSPTSASIFGSQDYKKFGSQKENCQIDPEEMAVGKQVECNASTKFSQNNFQEFLNIINYKDFGKIKINSKINLRRSASDCTIPTKKKFGEDHEEDASRGIRTFPSATRINKVHNWIKDYKMPPEKRRSVITVIGQTQTKPLSEILNEINQRRRLAKELDKHALCEAIMESAECKQDTKNLVAKVDFVLPDGKVIYSTEKVYVRKESSKLKIDNDREDYTQKNIDILEGNDSLRKRSYVDIIPERDSSASQLGRKSKIKRYNKKLAGAGKEKLFLKEKMKSTYEKKSFRLYRFGLLMLFIFFFIGGFYHMTASNNIFSLSGFFKPKTVPWYEKLLI